MESGAIRSILENCGKNYRGLNQLYKETWAAFSKHCPHLKAFDLKVSHTVNFEYGCDKKNRHGGNRSLQGTLMVCEFDICPFITGE